MRPEESVSGAAAVQARGAGVLIGGLADAGVREVVASPGSRSTPFLLAALEDARLRVHLRLDERSAAFFALGQARILGRPTLLLCTSGSAGSHYYPAVLEAEQSEIPLLVLTADRPPELVGCGANQTLDQADLFGRHVRLALDLPVADGSPSARRGLRRSAWRSVQESLGPRPGPVHLNARARKPLEPPPRERAGDEDDERSPEDAVRPHRPPVPLRLEPDRVLLEELLDGLARAERPALVAGPGPVERHGVAGRWLRWAAEAGIPVLAEVSSQLRSGPVDDDPRLAPPDLLWRTVLRTDSAAPDFVLQLGAVPAGGGWEASAVPDRHWMLSAGGLWTEPRGAATALLAGAEESVLGFLETALDRARGDGTTRRSRLEWHGRLERGARLAADALERHAGGAAFHEGAVARACVESLPSPAVLAVGNSLAVRVLEQWVPGGLPRDVRVWSQRGLSGIDGLSSGFAGAASVAGVPVVGLLGDLSFLHDLGGLEALRDHSGSLTVVVLDNGGGRLFEQLPVASRALDLTPWTTPPRLDLGRLATAADLEVVEVRDACAVKGAIRMSAKRPGTRIVRALVEPSGAAPALRELLGDLERSLREAT